MYSLLTLMLLSCNQDPIFHAVSQEVKPRNPRVQGSPTSIALLYRSHEFPEGTDNSVPVMYIASNKIQWYAQPDVPDTSGSSWNADMGNLWWNTDKGSIIQPGGQIIGLAATDEYLYVMYRNKVLERIQKNGTPDEQWTQIPIDTNDPVLNDTLTFDSIFSCNNRIFIGARYTPKTGAIPYSILYVNEGAVPGDDIIKSIKSDTFLLEGVAYNGSNYYLCLGDKYKPGGSLLELNATAFPAPTSNDLTEIINTDTKNPAIPFMSIISLEDDDTGVDSTIIAMDRPGILYIIDTAANTFTAATKKGTDTVLKMGTFNGFLGLWRDPDDSQWDPNDLTKLPKPILLLATYQGSTSQTTTGYTNGYFEFDLVPGGPNGKFDISAGDFHQPGVPGVNGLSTIIDNNNERYQSTIGKYPITSMYQTPKNIDDRMTLFASTLVAGLWSYRDRDKIPQWNAEE